MSASTGKIPGPLSLDTPLPCGCLLRVSFSHVDENGMVNVLAKNFAKVEIQRCAWCRDAVIKATREKAKCSSPTT